MKMRDSTKFFQELQILQLNPYKYSKRFQNLLHDIKLMNYEILYLTWPCT